MKIKNLLLLICITGCLAACSKREVFKDDFDHVAQYKLDSAKISQYVKDNKLVGEFHKSGIFYQKLVPGTGDIKYNENTQITANYKGSLLDGTVFDETTGTPRKFSLGSVIGGWQIGIPLIQKGGKIRLIIPSFYGYRNKAVGKIPANSVLDFTIELTDVQSLQ